jgi:hypothetical protein
MLGLRVDVDARLDLDPCLQEAMRWAARLRWSDDDTTSCSASMRWAASIAINLRRSAGSVPTPGRTRRLGSDSPARHLADQAPLDPESLSELRPCESRRKERDNTRRRRRFVHEVATEA